MNRDRNRSFYLKLIISLAHNKNKGFSLAEIIAVLIILTIVAVLSAPVFRLNNPTQDALNGTREILQTARNRAVSTTSAIRVRLDPNFSDNNKLLVQTTSTASCLRETELTEQANNGDTELSVASVDGFQLTNTIKVGSTDYNIIGQPVGQLKLTIGPAINSTQTVGTPVRLVQNWRTDGLFSANDLTFDKKNKNISIDSPNVSNWVVCFNSRGIASIYDDATLEETNTITLNITNSKSGELETVTVSEGGIIE